MAKFNLKRQGVQVFIPTIKITSRKGNTFLKKSVSLFPGYFFISFDSRNISWYTINSTYGVSKLVSFGKEPSIVPIKLIEILKQQCDDNNNFNSFHKLCAGNKVEIVNGPFSNFVGKIEKIEASKRIWVLLDYMKHKIPIVVKPKYLRILN